MLKKSGLAVCVILSATFFSCKTPISTISVNNIKSLKSGYSDGLIYALPKTIVEVQLDVTGTFKIKGPFHSFAESMLNFSEVITENSETYEITGYRFKTYAVPDENAFFSVESSGNNYSALLSLNSQGILTGLNNMGEIENNPILQYKLNGAFSKFEPISYSDVMAKDSEIEAVDTIFKQVFKDSAFVRVPVLKKQIRSKNIQDQAKEAASFIVRLRKRRFKLVAGVYDKFYEGKALEVALKELEREENEYISLFAGKTYSETKTFRFYFDPSTGYENDSIVLCKLNRNAGIMPTDAASGEPVIIQTETPPMSFIIQNYLNNKKDTEQQAKGLYYRIPAVCSFNLNYREEIFGSFTTEIAQKGRLVNLPIEIMESGRFQVKFFPETGALKSIIELQKKEKE